MNTIQEYIVHLKWLIPSRIYYFTFLLHSLTFEDDCTFQFNGHCIDFHIVLIYNLSSWQTVHDQYYRKQKYSMKFYKFHRKKKYLVSITIKIRETKYFLSLSLAVHREQYCSISWPITDCAAIYSIYSPWPNQKATYPFKVIAIESLLTLLALLKTILVKYVFNKITEPKECSSETWKTRILLMVYLPLPGTRPWVDFQINSTPQAIQAILLYIQWIVSLCVYMLSKKLSTSIQSSSFKESPPPPN